MSNDRTQKATEPPEGFGGVCDHYLARIGPYLRCTRCEHLEIAPKVRFNPDCPDCEWETHRCGRCGAQLDHTEQHRCRMAAKR